MEIELPTRESHRTGGPAGVVLDIDDPFRHLDQVCAWMVVWKRLGNIGVAFLYRTYTIHHTTPMYVIRATSLNMQHPGESPTYILHKDKTWNTRERYFV